MQGWSVLRSDILPSHVGLGVSQHDTTTSSSHVDLTWMEPGLAAPMESGSHNHRDQVDCMNLNFVSFEFVARRALGMNIAVSAFGYHTERGDRRRGSIRRFLSVLDFLPLFYALGCKGARIPEQTCPHDVISLTWGQKSRDQIVIHGWRI